MFWVRLWASSAHAVETAIWTALAASSPEPARQALAPLYWWQTSQRTAVESSEM
jgi:hypothetical protein